MKKGKFRLKKIFIFFCIIFMITLIIWIFANNHQQKEPSLQYKVEKKKYYTI